MAKVDGTVYVVLQNIDGILAVYRPDRAQQMCEQAAVSSELPADEEFSASVMVLLDTRANAETLKVASGATATSIPLATGVNWGVR